MHQTTLPDISVLDSTPLTFYHGYDASADSQTVGNLAAMMFDLVLMRHGCRAVILAGGATSLIGDPGGKDAERQLPDEAEIARNVAKTKQQLARIFTGHQFTLVNNLDWVKDLKLLDFLRDIGKHFGMTALLQREFIAERIGQGGSGISYAEFSYGLLQGYDYLKLHDQYGVRLQLGGSDQWGNILSGVELVRKLRGSEVHAITMPLVINKTTGKKFGKSEEGTIWLEATKTSPYQFYQFWLNTDDASVEDFLKLYTQLPQAEIEALLAEFEAAPQNRAAQRRLAAEVTGLVHGRESAERVIKLTGVLFGEQTYQQLGRDDFTELKRDLPTAEAHLSYTTLGDALVAAGLAASNSEARRLLGEGAIYVNGRQAGGQKTVFEESDVIAGHALLRRIGAAGAS